MATVGCAVVAVAWLWSRSPFGGIAVTGIFLLPLVMLIPFELCLAFVVASHFRIPEAFPALYGLKIPLLLAGGMLAAVCWHTFGTRRIRPFWSIELTLFLLFFVHVTIGVTFAINRPIAFDGWSSNYLKIGIVTLALAWLSNGSRQFTLATYAFIMAGLTVAAVALWNKIHGIGLVEGTRVTISREIGSVLGDPNDLALVLLFPVSFALGVLVTRGIPPVNRFLSGGAVIVIMLAILATQSRGGLLGLAAVVAFFAYRKIKSKLVVVTMISLVAVGLFAAAGISERATVTPAGSGFDESAMGRIEAWNTGLRMALTHPLTGVGLNNFVDNYYFFTNQWAGRTVAAHSIWIEVLGETGFPGFILFVIMMAVVGIRLRRTLHRLDEMGVEPVSRALAISLLASFVGVVVSGTFLSQAFTWPIYIILALGAAVSQYANGSQFIADCNARCKQDIDQLRRP